MPCSGRVFRTVAEGEAHARGRAPGREESGVRLKRQVLPHGDVCKEHSFPKYYGKVGGEVSTARCSLELLGGH